MSLFGGQIIRTVQTREGREGVAVAVVRDDVRARAHASFVCDVDHRSLEEETPPCA